MNYHIHITKTAERDLVNVADYIEYTLKNPSAADDLLDVAAKKISELSIFPEVHSIVDDPILSAWEIRFIVINNYLAFYRIVGDTVFVIRFLYRKRDWISVLKQGQELNNK